MGLGCVGLTKVFHPFVPFHLLHENLDLLQVAKKYGIVDKDEGSGAAAVSRRSRVRVQASEAWMYRLLDVYSEQEIFEVLLGSVAARNEQMVRGSGGGTGGIKKKGGGTRPRERESGGRGGITTGESGHGQEDTDRRTGVRRRTTVLSEMVLGDDHNSAVDSSWVLEGGVDWASGVQQRGGLQRQRSSAGSPGQSPGASTRKSPRAGSDGELSDDSEEERGGGWEEEDEARSVGTVSGSEQEVGVNGCGAGGEDRTPSTRTSTSSSSSGPSSVDHPPPDDTNIDTIEFLVNYMRKRISTKADLNRRKTRIVKLLKAFKISGNLTANPFVMRSQPLLEDEQQVFVPEKGEKSPSKFPAFPEIRISAGHPEMVGRIDTTTVIQTVRLAKLQFTSESWWSLATML